MKIDGCGEGGIERVLGQLAKTGKNRRESAPEPTTFEFQTTAKTVEQASLLSATNNAADVR